MNVIPRVRKRESFDTFKLVTQKKSYFLLAHCRNVPVVQGKETVLRLHI